VRLAVRAESALAAELVSAAALEAGAAGIEERAAGEGGARTAAELLVYTEARRAGAVRDALAALAAQGVRVGGAEDVPDTDWSLAWREGMTAIEIAPGLVVTPSFLPRAPRPGEAVVTIDPGQAFGTGGHASTRLALALVAAQPRDWLARARVLDVGTGSGVLALAALALGAPAAVGFDLDPLAAPAARENAERNGVAARLRVFTGGIGALHERAAFPLVVANLLRTELQPIAGAVARCVAPGGRLVLAGLLAAEREEIAGRFAREGLRVADERTETDATGDTWLGLALTR
jgi:ribosomal protein L11 methyltransferase